MNSIKLTNDEKTSRYFKAIQSLIQSLLYNHSCTITLLFYRNETRHCYRGNGPLNHSDNKGNTLACLTLKSIVWTNMVF